MMQNTPVLIFTNPSRQIDDIFCIPVVLALMGNVVYCVNYLYSIWYEGLVSRSLASSSGHFPVQVLEPMKPNLLRKRKQ